MPKEEVIETNPEILGGAPVLDRKSTRLNSSHLVISYAVFCLKKKKKLTKHVANQTLIITRPRSRLVVRILRKILSGTIELPRITGHIQLRAPVRYLTRRMFR